MNRTFHLRAQRRTDTDISICPGSGDEDAGRQAGGAGERPERADDVSVPRQGCQQGWQIGAVRAHWKPPLQTQEPYVHVLVGWEQSSPSVV